MKVMKKFTAIALSLAMMLVTSISVFAAANTYTITAPATNHQYEIYQIFTGDVSNGVLSNVKWGQNGIGDTGTAVGEDVLKALAEVSNISSDQDKLKVIKNYAQLNNSVTTISNGEAYNAEPGYYLIKDKDGTVSGKDSYTLYIVKVLDKDVTIEPKSNVPNFVKKIKDTNDTTGITSEWQDSADYDIGDQVPFKLEGTVADNYDDYKTYYFAFHDKEEAGLTFNENSVKVYVDDASTPIDTSYYTVKTSDTCDENCTFEVIFNNLKDIKAVKKGSKITVKYTSELNENAVLGNYGNVNKARLEFSNNPNNEQDGKLDTGKTPWDNVIVFTYKVVVNKVDGENNPLTGAEFTLSKKLPGGEKKDIAVVKSNNDTTFTFSGLDDGDYILTETTTPDGYNTIAPIEFTVTANHEITWNGENREDVLTDLTGDKATGNITFTADKANGSLSTNIVNKKGITLPGTGGMGTYLFYIIGGLLVVISVVLFVVKKRMEYED